jgi:hypothetical protein
VVHVYQTLELVYGSHVDDGGVVSIELNDRRRSSSAEFWNGWKRFNTVQWYSALVNS